jgi:hypothetical protein
MNVRLATKDDKNLFTSTKRARARWLSLLTLTVTFPVSLRTAQFREKWPP